MVKIQSSSQAEENEGTNMTDITTISIGRTSDFGSVEDSFYEELTVTCDSISYEYKPGMETEFNKSEEWFYRTTRPAFQELFRQAAAAAVEGINREVKKNSALGDFTRSLVQRWKWKDQRPKMPDLPDTLLPPDLPHTLLPPDPPDYPDLSDTLVLPDLPDYPDRSQSDDL